MIYDQNRHERECFGAKRSLGLTWTAVAEALGKGSPVFYIAALLGHQTLTPEEANTVGTLLELDEELTQMLAEPPAERGSADGRRLTIGAQVANLPYEVNQDFDFYENY